MAHTAHPPAHDAAPATAHAANHGAHDAHAGHDPKMFRDRFWLSLLLTLPILYFDRHIQMWLGYGAAEFPGADRVQPVLATLLFVYGGWPFLRGSVGELRSRRPGMMALVALAITVAYLYSVAATFGGVAGAPLYWELATLIVIMVLGHWLELASVAGASRALGDLAALVPATAERLVGGGSGESSGGRLETVPTAALALGDRVLVRPGQQVPVDGVIREGSGSVTEAFLTGESRPVAKTVGDEVVAGSVNGEGAFTAEVTRLGDDTALGQLGRLVREAQGSRSRFQNLADRAAGWLFYLALGAGTLTLVVWLLLGFGLQFALLRAVTVLVMACPHALGLAIPLVIVNATALGAKNGVLIRNREAFERAKDLAVVAFDKTGTLTEGAFGVRGIVTDGPSETEALELAAALEARSEHPLGRAVVAEAAARGLELRAVAEFEVTAGQGVAGTLGGRRYRIGRPEWAAEHGLSFADPLKEALTTAENRGESVVVLQDDARVVAVIALADRVRGGAKAAVAQLRAAGVESVMITGDAEAVARTVAAELGIARFYARTLPQDKAELVRKLTREGRTAFVGDGVNDAPALLNADLGVAVGAGTDIAIESADVVLLENDPLDVVRIRTLSAASYRKMQQNLIWAVGYNVVALPLAAGVFYAGGILLSPAVGAIFMSASTVIVAVNAVLLRRTRLA